MKVLSYVFAGFLLFGCVANQAVGWDIFVMNGMPCTDGEITGGEFSCEDWFGTDRPEPCEGSGNCVLEGANWECQSEFGDIKTGHSTPLNNSVTLLSAGTSFAVTVVNFKTCALVWECRCEEVAGVQVCEDDIDNGQWLKLRVATYDTMLPCPEP